MQQQELKIRFSTGELTKAEVILEAFGDNWNLLIHGKKKESQYMVTSQRGGDDARVFKTIDAACKVAKKIGFTDISVKYSGLTK